MASVRSDQHLLVVLLLLLAAANAGAQANRSGDVAFPLEEGTYWVYKGVARWTHANSSETSETKVVWKTEILKVIRRGELFAAVVKGLPSDLDWSDGHPEPSQSLIVRSAENKFYKIGPERVDATLKRLADPGDSLEDLLTDDDLFLALPLAQGKKFCEPEGMQRDDGHYCWVTGEPTTVSLAAVKGLTPQPRTAFPIAYLTNPDDLEFDFVPGVGIITYGYHHHGTVAETELRLVEFHAGPATPSQ